jgi:FMN phosphatase YigB (HAD superfamily)
MKHVDFGRLDFKKVAHIIYDLDNCLFPYPEGYAEEFSVQTAKSAIKLAHEKILTGGDDAKLLSLLEMDFDDVVEIAKQSYADHRCTTAIFERDYRLHGIRLYQDHHTGIVNEIVTPTFQRLARHGLRQAMVMLHNIGIQQHLFTNGTQDYAKAVTDKLGTLDCFKTIVGIDSYDDIGHPSGAPEKTGKIILFQKYIRAAWHDALEFMKIPTYVTALERQGGAKKKEEDKIYPFVIGQEKQSGRNYKYWNYSNTIFIDDSPENLKVAKELGMQTVLLKTTRVDYDPKIMPYVDAVTDNIDVFICLIAHECEKLNPIVIENKNKLARHNGP